MKSLLKVLCVLVGMYIIPSTAQASAVGANKEDQVVCEMCGGNALVLVGNTGPASGYEQAIETKNFSFIKEDMGSSCYGGGWMIVDKRQSSPTAKEVGTDCKEITDVSAFEDPSFVYLKVTYYGGKKVAYKFNKD